MNSFRELTEADMDSIESMSASMNSFRELTEADMDSMENATSRWVPCRDLGRFESTTACDINLVRDSKGHERFTPQCKSLCECKAECKHADGCTGFTWWPWNGGCKLVTGAFTTRSVNPEGMPGGLGPISGPVNDDPEERVLPCEVTKRGAFNSVYPKNTAFCGEPPSDANWWEYR